MPRQSTAHEPQSPLATVPALSSAKRLAEGMRRAADQPLEGFLNLRALCLWARARVQVTELSADTGGEEGLLIPLSKDRFGISVDPRPSKGWTPGISESLRRDLLRHRTRFRIGHELGHMFFYRRRPGAPPKRSLFDSPEQEAFCDHFSRQLLAPARQAARVPATAPGLLKFQRTCDVSLEVAARAVADAQPEVRISIWREDARQDLRLQWASAGRGLRGFSPPEDGLWLEERGQLLSVS